MIEFSFIIPVYNRPLEIKELLESFKALTTSDAFEIVIIEDGSTLCCSDIVAGYQDALDISYYQNLTQVREILETLVWVLPKEITILF